MYDAQLYNLEVWVMWMYEGEVSSQVDDGMFLLSLEEVWNAGVSGDLSCCCGLDVLCSTPSLTFMSFLPFILLR